TNDLRKYNTEEINLSNEETVSATLLVAHWKRLDLIAANLEQLDRSGRLGRLDAAHWQALRHELGELFQVTPEVTERGTHGNGKLAAADFTRQQNLIRIALV